MSRPLNELTDSQTKEQRIGRANLASIGCQMPWRPSQRGSKLASVRADGGRSRVWKRIARIPMLRSRSGIISQLFRSEIPGQNSGFGPGHEKQVVVDQFL